MDCIIYKTSNSNGKKMWGGAYINTRLIITNVKIALGDAYDDQSLFRIYSNTVPCLISRLLLFELYTIVFIY